MKLGFVEKESERWTSLDSRAWLVFFFWRDIVHKYRKPTFDILAGKIFVNESHMKVGINN